MDKSLGITVQADGNLGPWRAATKDLLEHYCFNTLKSPWPFELSR